MHKSIHLFQLLGVCLWVSAVIASPPVNCVVNTACVQCDEQVAKAVASLQQTIQLQASTIEHLVKTAQNHTTPTPPDNDDLVLNAVSTAVAPLQQTIQLQTLAIEGLFKPERNQTPSTHAPLCASQEFVSSTIQSAVVTLQQAMEEIWAKSSVKSGENLTALTPALPLPNTIQEINSRNASCGQDSGYTFYSKTGGCYKFNKNHLEWPAANSTCHAEGAYLAVVNSRKEELLLNNILKMNEGLSWAFIGDYIDSNNVRSTVTGEIVEAAVNMPGHSPWDDTYPSDNIQQGNGVTGFGVVYNIPSNWVLAFICEKSPQYE